MLTQPVVDVLIFILLKMEALVDSAILELEEIKLKELAK
jgi:hypothetical protein